jgi:O-antigen/teichoic acid export membrane protein
MGRALRIARSAQSRHSPTGTTGLEGGDTVPSQTSGWIHTGTNFLLSSAASKSVAALVDQGVVSATNFLTGVIIGRACTKEELGLYMLGLTIVLFVTDLQTSLISTPYMVYSPRLKGNAYAEYTGSMLIHQLAFSALVILPLVLGGLFLSNRVGPRDLTPVIWTLVVVLTFIMLRDNVRRICFAGLRMNVVLLFDSAIAIVQTGILLLLAYVGLLSASAAFWIIGIACGIATLVWLIVNRNTYSIVFARANSDFRKNWAFGRWVLASGLLWAISMNLYPWLLVLVKGAASVGVWAACLGIVALVNPVFLGVQNFLGPKIANVYAEGGLVALRSFVCKSSAVFGLIMLSFCIALFFLGDSLVALIYGNKYAGNGLVVSILALSGVAAAVAFSFSRALLVIEKADVDFWVNFVPLFILFTFGLWLVKSLGLLGAAYGLLLAQATASGARGAAFLVLLGRRIREQG